MTAPSDTAQAPRNDSSRTGTTDDENAGTELALPIVDSYPFHPSTAFQDLRLREDDARNQAQAEGSTAATDARSPNTQTPADAESDVGSQNTRTPAPESLVQGSEILGIEVVRRPPGLGSVFEDSVLLGVENAADPRASFSGAGGDAYGLWTGVDYGHEVLEQEEETTPVSPLSRTHNSLRRLLSGRSSSSWSSRLGSSRRSSLRSHPSTRSSRWGSLRGRRREGDLEAGLAVELASVELAELESVNPKFGPFEMCALTREDQRKYLERELRPSPSNARDRQTKLRLIENLFGRGLCSPQYLALRRVYMKQIDEKLSLALKDASVANPDASVWPNPFTYLISHLGLLSRELQSTSSVTTFVLSHMTEFAAMIRSGNISPPVPGRVNAKPTLYDPWHLKVTHEWMLFGLESWLMLDLSESIDDRHDLPSSPSFCNLPIGDMLKPRLPANTDRAAALAPTPFSAPAMITPSEITASMLQEWKGIRFVWTDSLAEHLRLDSQTRVVKLYSQVAYCQLHAIANEDSSLKKAGFVTYHRILVEVADTYRLLFGADRRSMNHFAELGDRKVDGFFNIFKLPPCDSEPRFLYNVTADFPVFGERLLVLKQLLKPTGLAGLWKDRRDSLQWYTFWAVVLFGIFTIVVSVVQIVLAAVQAYASMKALKLPK